MRSLILAAVSPDNTPHGYNLTFAFPMLLFIIIGVILYLLFSRPHRRVPARMLTLPASSADVPEPEVAASAAVAGGLNVAPGGGVAETHLEPHGSHLVATGAAEEADVAAAETDGTAEEADVAAAETDGTAAETDGTAAATDGPAAATGEAGATSADVAGETSSAEDTE
jgi:hypothetical protein